MFYLALCIQLIAVYGLLTFAQSPLQLGYIPLAVKTPYLHGWVQSPGGISPAAQWPNFVSNDRILGWEGMIRVDNQAYIWLGRNKSDFTRTVTSEITPSRSIFRIEAGPIQFNVTFFSPIEPTDYVRQSMPFSYMYLDGIVANDSQPHTVQVYSDISAEWVSRDDTTLVKWSTMNTSDTIYHAVQQQSPSSMVENGGISEDATVYFATVKRPRLTYQTGNAVIIRNIFATNGTLTNAVDPNFRAISPDWPVFALSVDLGIVSPGDQPDPVVWAIGLVRDPLVTYTMGGLTQKRSAYYWSNYTRIEEVISAFLNNFSDALSQGSALDNKVLSAGLAVSPEYAGILSLVTRQMFASMDITIPSAEPGHFNTSDIKVFMKDIGQSQRTNPVEVIYGALPGLLLFNTSLARDLLQPLLESQSSNPYAAPDLGASYPYIYTNSTDTHILAVENCGNMLIMAYTQAVKSGDGTLLSRYYSVLQHWTDFLVENTLHPRGFTTADGLNSSDMSNLALKGILGIYSMAKINEALRVPNATYMDQATRLIEDWKQLAIAEDGHIQAVYGQTGSWGLMYNLFPAVWLKTGLIEDSVLESQAEFYAQQSFPDFGLSLDTSRPDTAYPHWTLMTAATIPDSLFTIRNRLITSIYQRAYMPNSTSPLPVAYQPSNGNGLSGSGSPILGAAFALAAMGLQNVDIRTPQFVESPPSGSHTRAKVGLIIGGVLGSLAFLAMATAIFNFWRKHKSNQPKTDPFPLATNNNTDMVQVSYRVNMGGQWLPGRSRPSHPLPPLGTRKTLISPPAQRLAAPPLRKQRETLDPPDQRIPTQSESPPLAPSSSDSINVSGTGELIAGLEQLRREVESLRRTADAPPEYS